MRTLWVVLVSIVAALSSCGEDDAPGDGATPAIDVRRPECENLNPGSCMAPWPSSRYLTQDPATATGWRIEIPTGAMLADRMGVHVDPAPYSQFDGFSRNTPIATAVDGGVLDTSTLAGQDDIGASLAADSPTVLLDTVTGERVAHMAEIDAWGGADPMRSTLYLRPIRPLEEDRRYAVAIRGLTYQDGTAVQPSAYFAALRDTDETSVDELEARRAHFEEIFGFLTSAGITRGDLIEAWDFRTGTAARARRDLRAMREDALSRIGDGGTECTVDTVETDFGHTYLYRRFSGTFEVPLYAESEEPGARIVRDADGMPVFQRMGTARFVAAIPHSAMAASEPVPLVVFGHGLLGEAPDIGLDDGEGGIRVEHPYTPLFEDIGMAAVATDWWGFSSADTSVLFDEIGEFSRFAELPDRMMQAMVNFLTLARNFKGGCRALAEWDVGGATVIDEATLHYVGTSGGSVLGSTFAALTPDIQRFVLIIGGTHWPTLMSRSFAFFPFNLALNGTYSNKRDRDIMLAMTAQLWDLADGANFAPLIMREPLPGSPDKQLLLPTVLNDALVNNVTSDYLARVAGFGHVMPSVYEPYDVPAAAYGDASGQVMYDLGVDPLEPGTVLPADNGVHAAAVTIDALRQQVGAYLRDGTIQSFCDGLCDPE